MYAYIYFFFTLQVFENRRDPCVFPSPSSGEVEAVWLEMWVGSTVVYVC